MQHYAQGIERLAPQPEPPADVKSADAYLWDAERKTLLPVEDVRYLDLPLLKGIDEARDTLLANTLQFTKGYSANNALLWGARGMGKSSLIKAIHAHINKQKCRTRLIVLIEIHREDIAHAARSCCTHLRGLGHPPLHFILRRFIVRRRRQHL